MKLTFYSTHSYDKQYFDIANKEYGHELLYLDTALDEVTVPLAAGSDAVCIFVNDHADAATLKLLKEQGVKILALRCAGFNQVDVKAAKELGIAVVRVPSYSPEAVAEHAVAMMLTLNRKTHKAFNRIREGNFSLNNLTGFNLYGKSIGLIGLGKIALAFAKIMNGFGCHIKAYDPFAKTAPEYVSLVSLDELLATADAISIHCPLTEGTHHLINKDTLAKMKDGVMIINTSRGAVIDTCDVIEALKAGKVGYLGIDVYEQEEHLFFRDLSERIIPDDQILRLMSFPNVLITAHQGFFTKEALTEIAHTTLQNLIDVSQGIKTANDVTMSRPKIG